MTGTCYVTARDAPVPPPGVEPGVPSFGRSALESARTRVCSRRGFATRGLPARNRTWVASFVGSRVSITEERARRREAPREEAGGFEPHTDGPCTLLSREVRRRSPVRLPGGSGRSEPGRTCPRARAPRAQRAGQDGGIRTRDLRFPEPALCSTELRPEENKRPSFTSWARTRERTVSRDRPRLTRSSPHAVRAMGPT